MAERLRGYSSWVAALVVLADVATRQTGQPGGALAIPGGGGGYNRDAASAAESAREVLALLRSERGCPLSEIDTSPVDSEERELWQKLEVLGGHLLGWFGGAVGSICLRRRRQHIRVARPVRTRFG